MSGLAIFIFNYKRLMVLNRFLIKNNRTLPSKAIKYGHKGDVSKNKADRHKSRSLTLTYCDTCLL